MEFSDLIIPGIAAITIFLILRNRYSVEKRSDHLDIMLALDLKDLDTGYYNKSKSLEWGVERGENMRSGGDFVASSLVIGKVPVLDAVGKQTGKFLRTRILLAEFDSLYAILFYMLFGMFEKPGVRTRRFVLYELQREVSPDSGIYAYNDVIFNKRVMFIHAELARKREKNIVFFFEDDNLRYAYLRGLFANYRLRSNVSRAYTLEKQGDQKLNDALHISLTKTGKI